MADDEFDIDIYGDANPEDTPFKKDEEGDVKIDGVDEAVNGHADNTNGLKHDEEQDDPDDDYVDIKVTKDDNDRKMDEQQKIKSTDESGADLLKIPKQAPQQQGVKRKEGSDDRPIDPGATTALLISELHWWNTDDDVRGWVNQAQVEDELKEITFSEHKVNGKSKGHVSVSNLKLQRLTNFKSSVCRVHFPTSSYCRETQDRCLWRGTTVCEKTHGHILEPQHEPLPNITKGCSTSR